MTTLRLSRNHLVPEHGLKKAYETATGLQLRSGLSAWMGDCLGILSLASMMEDRWDTNPTITLDGTTCREILQAAIKNGSPMCRPVSTSLMCRVNLPLRHAFLVHYPEQGQENTQRGAVMTLAQCY